MGSVITLAGLGCSYNEAVAVLQRLEIDLRKKQMTDEERKQTEDAYREIKEACVAWARTVNVVIPPRYDPRTIEGQREGVAGCAECGGTWNWLKPFDIPVEPGSCCCPVCINCARSLTIPQLICHVEDLMKCWYKQALDAVLPAPDVDKLTQYAAEWLERWAKASRKFDFDRDNSIRPVSTHNWLVRDNKNP